MVGIDSVTGGATSGNGWGRPISMSGGMDYWIGSWADSGTGQEVYHYSGSSWTKDRASYDAAMTTPREAIVPVATSRGLPRSSGRRTSSTETKKASMSTCA